MVLTKLFNATLIQPDFFSLSENDFRGLHLHNLKSLWRYHCTLHSHNLTFTTSVKFDFRILHLHNLKSLSTIRLYTTLAQPGLHEICTTWFQGSALAQPEIFISIVKLHISRSLAHPNFHYIRKTWFPWLFHSCCGCFLHVHTYFVPNFMSRLSRSLFMFRRRISVQCNAVENSFFCSLVCPGSSCCVATVSSIQIYGNVWNCWQGISFLC